MELLGQAGIEVVVANNGQEGVEFWPRTPLRRRADGLPDAGDGRLHGDARNPQECRRLQGLPIIAMTANAMVGDREKVLEAGMDDHIAKPLNVGEMFETIAKWIKPANPAEFEKVGDGGTAPDMAVALPELPGIDVKAGMATTMQNLKLYTKLLTKFRNGQADFAALFKQASEDVDPTAAARAAHTLKGTAGNIGAKGVQAAAAGLEQACKDDAATETVEALLAKVLIELQPVIGLEKLGAGETAEIPTDSATADPARIKALLDRLKAMLKDSDTEASDVLDELLPLARGTPIAVQLKQVATAISEYDFDAAMGYLSELDS